MNLFDRFILRQFLVNFLALYAMLFLFAASIDVILNLDSFVSQARRLLGEDAGGLPLVMKLISLMAGFQSPRAFQFYSYVHGMVGIGAMGFTLARMYRHKELVAMLASGVSLHRVAVPFALAMFIISMGQLVNQELILPRVAPLLLRGHSQLGKQTVDRFEIRFTRDHHGNLLQSPAYDPAQDALLAPTILERDDRGRTVRRITADRAVWNHEQAAWIFEGGEAVTLPGPEVTDGVGSELLREPVAQYATNLSPHVLTLRRYNQFAGMLSMGQIGQMLDTEGVADERPLLRFLYSRFSSVLVNVMVLFIALPCFLLREPANLMSQTMLCAGITVTAMMGSAMFMMMDLAAIAPAVSVFLPVIVLFPVALARMSALKT